MELEELRTKKKELESRLQDVILEELAWFKGETGWTPDGIYVEFIDATSWGDPRPTYILGKVTVKLEAI
jgi:hypothetical protein